MHHAQHIWKFASFKDVIARSDIVSTWYMTQNMKIEESLIHACALEKKTFEFLHNLSYQTCNYLTFP